MDTPLVRISPGADPYEWPGAVSFIVRDVRPSCAHTMMQVYEVEHQESRGIRIGFLK